MVYTNIPVKGVLSIWCSKSLFIRAIVYLRYKHVTFRKTYQLQLFKLARTVDFFYSFSPKENIKFYFPFRLWGSESALFDINLRLYKTPGSLLATDHSKAVVLV